MQIIVSMDNHTNKIIPHLINIINTSLLDYIRTTSAFITLFWPSLEDGWRDSGQENRAGKNCRKQKKGQVLW